jgi:signal transduction histidine kinase
MLVLVPIALVALLETLSGTVLDEALPFPRDTLLIIGVTGVLGVAFAAVAFSRIDALTGTLRARNAELEARGASARALHRVSVAIAALSDVDRVLEAVVTHARELLAADVAVLLLESGDGRLVPRAASGVPGALVARPLDGIDPLGQTDAGTAGSNPADAMLAHVDPDHAVVRLAAPLQRGGTTIGLLAVGSAAPRGFDADEVETLASLANQATIALEHDRLEARLRELAVVEERERIARELHDGIAQVLGYVNTKSGAIDDYLAAGRVDEARLQARELGAAARAVYVDVREAILGLRSPIEPGQGLGAAVEAHARRVAADSRFGLHVAIPPGVRDLRLDPEAEAQVYRVVQEALTNVRKHAGARLVRITMTSDGDRLELRIEDDGRGLASSPPPADVPRYGLRSMQERATAIGATLSVRDGRSGGVIVEMSVPLAPHVRRAAPASTVATGTGG